MKLPQIADSEDHVSLDAVTKAGLRLVPAPAVLVVIRGMILARTVPVAITTAEVTINQDMKALLPHRDLRAGFLFLWLNAARPALLSMIAEAGHGTKALRTDLWSGLPVAVPPFASLLIIPMLTPDDPKLAHGATPPSRFQARPEVRDLVIRLRTEPRNLEILSRLGSLPGCREYSVHVFGASWVLPHGWSRLIYWSDAIRQIQDRQIVFIDPDNGFETPTGAGPQHVRYSEVAAILDELPRLSAVCIFQYRPQGTTWDEVFARITNGLPSSISWCSVHDGQLAFLFFGHLPAMATVKASLTSFEDAHSKVRTRAGGAGDSL